MTFEPVLAWWVLGLLAVLTLVLRMYTLYRVLVDDRLHVGSDAGHSELVVAVVIRPGVQ